ncbi:hypothetical protein MSAN_01300200 [Mycena sanguinolenta]|uniref:Uncharacterized protein n=1 Tax=Mycena sanguinolenta TaxID=230812 RepID=A0A8H6Y9U9_9AGAR|nr:hypothetical protein MSAN_01300200 [Mycena sanguinolenta]
MSTPSPDIVTLQQQLTAVRGHLAWERQRLQDSEQAHDSLLEAHRELEADFAELQANFDRVAALHEWLLTAYDELNVNYRGLRREHAHLQTLYENSLRSGNSSASPPSATPSPDAVNISLGATAPISRATVAAAASTPGPALTAAAASLLAEAAAAATTPGEVEAMARLLAAVASAAGPSPNTDSTGTVGLARPVWTGLVLDIPDRSRAVNNNGASCKRCAPPSNVESGVARG